MNYLEFRNRFFDLACFSNHQVYTWHPDFDRNNLSRWVNKGLLIRLKQGFYTFPEYLEKSGYAFFFANRIYNPSYISLHSALAFYGLIPELVAQVTSVTTLKTASFENSAGFFSYKSIRENLMFGYEMRTLTDERPVRFASPEKALLDLLYLYPFYDTSEEMEALRLDDSFLQTDLNKELIRDYCKAFKSKAMLKRGELLLKTYNL
ncbi:MAG: hypothetical protein R6V49_02110 [Bacteroidales bacterium]